MKSERRLGLLFAIYDRVLPRFRSRRMERFAAVMANEPAETVVDVGGAERTWSESAWARSRRIILVNIDHDAIEPNRKAPSRSTFGRVVGDGTCLPFRTDAAGLAYSNSVIEHVGSWEDQKRFAQAIRQLAPALWVQTPAKSFPIETHYLTPIVHYLPRSVQRRLLRNFSIWGLIARPQQSYVDQVVDTTRLLSRGEFSSLFPDCEILTERSFGLARCYIAVRQSPVDI